MRRIPLLNYSTRRRTSSNPLPSVSRLAFRTPDRSGSPVPTPVLPDRYPTRSPPNLQAMIVLKVPASSASRGAGHHAAFLNSNQYRSAASASRERQTSTSASPHDRPRLPLLGEPVRFPTSTGPGPPRTSLGLQPFPENMKQGIPFPGKHTLPRDRSQGSSWGSFNSLRSFGDVNVHRRHNNEDHRQLLRVDEALSGVSDDVVDRRHYLQRMHSVPSIRKMPSRQSMDSKQMDASSGTKEAQKFLGEVERLQGRVNQMDAPVDMPEDGKLDPIVTWIPYT